MPGSVLVRDPYKTRTSVCSGGTQSSREGGMHRGSKRQLRQVLSWVPSTGGFETIRGESLGNSDTTTPDGSGLEGGGEGGVAFLEHILCISLFDAHGVPVR